MNKCLLVSLVLFTCFLQRATAQKWQWAKESAYVSSSNQFDVKMAVDNGGTIYQIGKFTGQITIGNQTLRAAGTSDLYVAGYSSTGALLFARQLNITQAAVGAYDIAIDSEGLPVVVGSLTGSLNIVYDHPTLANNAIVEGQRSFVASLSYSGLARWVKYSTAISNYPADEYMAVATDKAGSIYIAFNRYRLNSSVLASYVQMNLSGASITESGVSYPGTGTTVSNAEDISVDDAGNIYLGGTFSGRIIFGGAILDQNFNYSNVFLSKFSKSSNTWQWAKQSQGVYKSYLTNNSSIAISTTGPVISNVGVDCFSFEGQHVWHRNANNIVKAVVADKSGGIFATGGYILVPPNSFRAHYGFVYKYNTTGTLVWEKRFAKTGAGDPATGFGSSLAMTNASNLIVAGAVTGGVVQFDDFSMGNGSGNFSQFLTSLPIQPTLRVISPNGGELLTDNAQYIIRWERSLVNTINIKYRANGVLQQIASQVDASLGQYAWTVPSVNAPSCRIIIEDASNAAIADSSDAAFAITPSKFIQVLSPNGGESLEGDSLYQVRWQSAFVQAVNIRYKTNGQSQLIASNIGANSGQHVWIVPYVDFQTGKIIVEDATNSSVADSSDVDFTIRSNSTVSLISPNGGETLFARKTYPIRWYYYGSAAVNLEFTTNNGASWQPIASNVPNSGSYNWTVPTVGATTCRVKVTSTGGEHSLDTSDQVFTIINPPVVSVLSPNGGETYAWVFPMEISWKTNKVDDFLLEYSIDGGSTWNEIAMYNPGPTYNVRNPVNYSWSIPRELPSASTCLIRVSPASAGGTTDVSDDYFTIITNASIATGGNATARTAPVGAGKQKIKLYPNPVTGWVNIQIQDAELVGPALIEVYSVAGHRVWNQEVKELNANTIRQIDLSAQKTGLYMLSVRAGKNAFQCLFLKQ